MAKKKATTKKAKPAKAMLVSKYAGPITNNQRTLPVCKTVGELVRHLARLPVALPLADPIQPLWCNVGRTDSYMPESLVLEEAWD